MSKTDIQPMMNSVSSHALLYGFFGLVLYFIYGVIYRLYLSPLAKIPGPRLAALTSWYICYYDVIKGGKFVFKIKDLHEEYGPILRIAPDQVHFNDPEFLGEIYPGPAKKTDKPRRYASMFGQSGSAFATGFHDLHRARRALLNPFFSKRSITSLEPVIQSAVDTLCRRLEGFRESKEIVNMRHAYVALTTDVIRQYCFATSDNDLEAPKFNPFWFDTLIGASKLSHTFQQFPWLFPMLNAMPLWFTKRASPLTYKLIELKHTLEDQIRKLMDEKYASKSSTDHPTIFHALMDENIPAPERRFDRLSDEAVNTVGAGAITTAHTLGVITYFLLDSPSILRTLTAELKHAMPDKTAMPPLQQLEQLPYLSAVISEGLRMSYGVSHRLQRSAPDRSIVYKDYTIPPNTPVSMSSVLIHDNPDIFPDPHTFHPERWLDAKPVPSLPGAPPQRLDKYLLSFSKGTRACLGMNLAYAELYLALAHIFRTFEMKLFDTVRERDIDLAHDFFSPSPTLGSKGCRVTVVGRVD